MDEGILRISRRRAGQAVSERTLFQSDANHLKPRRTENEKLPGSRFDLEGLLLAGFQFINPHPFVSCHNGVITHDIAWQSFLSKERNDILPVFLNHLLYFDRRTDIPQYRKMVWDSALYRKRRAPVADNGRFVLPHLGAVIIQTEIDSPGDVRLRTINCDLLTISLTLRGSPPLCTGSHTPHSEIVSGLRGYSLRSCQAGRK